MHIQSKNKNFIQVNNNLIIKSFLKKKNFDKEMYFNNHFVGSPYEFLPKLFGYSKKEKFIIYNKINHSKYFQINNTILRDYIQKLYAISFYKRSSYKIYSSDYSLGPKDYFNKLVYRFNNLPISHSLSRSKKIINKSLNKFYKLFYNDLFFNHFIITKDNLIISNSDVGFHNVLISNKLFIIDFEHSGLDDKYKIPFDLIYNARRPLNNNLKTEILDIYASIFKPYNFFSVAHYYELLTLIKWMMIIYKSISISFDLKKVNQFYNYVRLFKNEIIKYSN